MTFAYVSVSDGVSTLTLSAATPPRSMIVSWRGLCPKVMPPFDLRCSGNWDLAFFWI